MISINASSTSLVAQNNLSNTQDMLNDNMLQLSTGKRINSAADDAAGLQITNRMETQISGLDQAQRNANDAISMAQTAEGAMQETTDILNRMNDLALQSANDSNTAEDRDAINKEINQLQDEIDDISKNTNFAGINLLDGSADLSFQVGTGTDSSDTIAISVGDMSSGSLSAEVTTYDYSSAVDGTSGKGDAMLEIDANGNLDGEQTMTITSGGETQDIVLDHGTSLGDAEEQLESVMGGNVTLTDATPGTAGTADMKFDSKVGQYSDIDSVTTADSAGGAIGSVTTSGVSGSLSTESIANIDLSTQEGATGAIMVLEGALAQVDGERADLGAVQNRLESKVDNMANIEENMGAAQSQMLDADFAQQTTDMTSNQMLMQSGASVLSQAKSMPQYATMLMG